MKYLFVLLSLFLFFTSCSITGKSISILPDQPAFYIDAPDKVYFSGPLDDDLINITIIAGGYKNISGFSFDMIYSDSLLLNSLIPGGVFGNSADNSYYCIPSSNTGNSIQDLACIGLPGYDTTPNMIQPSYLYNLSFTPTIAGEVTFGIDSALSSTLLVDDNAEEINLFPSGYETKKVLVCQDYDEDGEYSSLECNGGISVDCDDTKDYVNSYAVEYCNNIDNDCDGNPRNSMSCSDYKPTITQVTENGVLLDNSGLQIAGIIDFIVTTVDKNLSEDGVTDLDNDVLYAEFYFDENHDGIPELVNTITDSILLSSQERIFSLNYDTTLLSEGNNDIIIKVYDGIGGVFSVTYTFEVKNINTCIIQSLDWNTTSAEDGDYINLTIIGNQDCLNTEYSSLNYQECEGIACIPLTTSALSLPQTIIFTDKNIISYYFFANWFVGTLNPVVPSIKLGITDSLSEKETSLLSITNKPPIIFAQGITSNINSAEAYLTVSDLSDISIRVGSAYGLEDVYANTYSMVTSKSFTIPNLSPLTTYYYVIEATDEGMLSTSTGELQFTTITYNADFNNDGLVNIIDLGEIVLHFRETYSLSNNPIAIYDLNNDKIINIIDITKVINLLT